MTVQERHLTGDSFASYLSRDHPVDHPIEGSPRIILFFDPDNRRIGLRGPAQPNERPSGTGLEHLSISTVHQDGQRSIEIAVENPALFADAYPVLRGVADRAQLDGMSLTRALKETLRRLGHLIRAEDKLTREVETGLLGELTFLLGLAGTTSLGSALQAWRGGSEEHDFGLAEIDVEVKTTTSEARLHRISSLNQLQPTGQRPLWLLSFQVTPAGSGGTTVGDLIGRVRARLTTAAQRDNFDALTQAAGWRHRFADAPLERWRLRSEPALFAVTGDFPRLTLGLLQSAGVPLDLISDVRYRLDLTTRAADPAPNDLHKAVTAGRQELP